MRGSGVEAMTGEGWAAPTSLREVQVNRTFIVPGTFQDLLVVPKHRLGFPVSVRVLYTSCNPKVHDIPRAWLE